MLADDAGTDTLDGEAGTDTLVGGAGNDTYWLGRAKPSSPPRWPASSSNWPSTWSAASSPEKAWGQVLHSCNFPFFIVHDPIFGLNLLLKKGSRYRKFYSRCWATIVRSRPGSGGLLSSCSVPCNRWGMIVCGSGERMEILKTLQKQELLAPVEHAVAAIFVVRKAGEKQC